MNEQRRLGSLVLVVFALGGLSGGALAMVLIGSGKRASAPVHASHELEGEAKRRGEQGDPLVCVRGRGPRSRALSDREQFGPSCDRERLEVAVCEARLDECSRTKTDLRVPWPENAVPVEEPSSFTDIATSALAACDLEGYLDMIDCTEYPCVVGMRPQSQDASALASELERVNQAIDGCAPLREAFGVKEDQLDALEVHSVRVPCEGTDETAFVLAAMSTEGEAWALWNRRGEEDNLTEVLRWMFRRGDDVAALWDCGAGGAGGMGSDSRSVNQLNR